MYLGDFTTANTVYVGFNTFDSNDPSASVTLTGLAVGDIKVYKNGSTTERSSTAGFTLLDTDGTDFDGNTGIHGFSLDLSDNTDSGFYAAGGEYMVVVASVTVDGATVNFIAATFSIERTGGALALLKGTNSLSDIEGKIDTLTSDLTAVKTKTDYLPSVTAGGSGGLFIAGSNAATTVNFTGNLSGSVGSVTAAITLPTIPTNWISATGIASSAITSAKFASGAITSTVLASNAIGASQIASDAITAAKIAADAIGASELATDAVTEIVNAVWAAAARTLTAATNFNNLSQSDIRTAVGMASANLDTQFTTLGGKLPSALVGGRMDANMSAVAGSATAATNLSESALGIVPGECEGTPTTSVIQTDLAEATDDHYIGRVIVFTSGAAAGEASNITDYVGSTGTVTIAPVTTAPSATDKFVIV